MPILSSLGSASTGNYGSILRRNAKEATISPTISKKTVWDFDIDGTLEINYAGEWIIIPATTVTVNVRMWGAGGGQWFGEAGGGGYSGGNVIMIAGQTYTIRVGGTHGNVYCGGVAADGNPSARSGGGYSGLFIGAITQANSIIVAGGGGGSSTGAPGGIDFYNAGAGGGLVAGSSSIGSGGSFGFITLVAGGGTQSAGGTTLQPNCTNPGSAGGALTSEAPGGAGRARTISQYCGGGGGSGYFGGAGGSGSEGAGNCTGMGGGGGSGFISPTLVISGSGSTIAGVNANAALVSDGSRGTAGNVATAGKLIIRKIA